MPDNRNTEHEKANASLDAEDWEIVFAPYAEYPQIALLLARHLVTLRERLQAQPPDVSEVIAAIDDATEGLYPHTNFHKGSYELYRVLLEGRATRAHEALIESLGVRF